MTGVVIVGDWLAQPTRGRAGEVLAAAEHARPERPQEVAAYLVALEMWCRRVGLDFALLAAQSAHETNWWRSDAWLTSLNPAGIGITDGPNVGRVYSGGADAAAAHVVHMYAYVYGPVPTLHPLSPYTRLDPRYNEVANGRLAGSVSTLDDLTGRWATDLRYSEKIAAVARAIWPSGPMLSTGNSQKEQIMPTLPAVPNWGTLGIPVIVKLIPAGQTNQRPGGAMTAETITHHETANTAVGANALMHSTWLDNGAPGGADRQVGVHFFVDDTRVVQKLPLNEHGWHAGDGSNGPGNRKSIAVEICVNKDGNRQMANRNARILTAYILTLMGRDVSVVVQHNKWSGKNCPTFIRNGGEWNAHVADIEARRKALLAGPTTPPVTPTPPPPSGGYPEGMTYEMARAWFGSVQALGNTWAFDPAGPVSVLWLAQPTYPALVSVERVGTAQYFRFANGLVIWRPTDTAAVRVMARDSAAEGV